MAKPTAIRGLGPGTPLDLALPRILRARLRDVRKWEQQVAARPEGEPVHAMRIATRRLRAALAVFDDGHWRRLDRAVKRLQDALGDVRDLELQAAALPPAAARLREQLRGELPAKRAELHRELRAWRTTTVPDLRELAAHAGGDGALRNGRTRRRLRGRLERVNRLVDHLGRRAGAKRVHRLRIAVKKLRYEGELLEPAFPGPVGRLHHDLGHLQETLGELHDLDVRLDLLDGHAARDRQLDPGLTELRHGLQVERDRRRDELLRKLRRWRRDRLAI